MTTIEEEVALIIQAKEGNFDAFEAIYEMHKASIFHTALAITNDRLTAEEILQETFLRAFKNIQKMREGVSIAPWLYRVAVNLAYDLSARNRRGVAALNNLIDWLMTPLLTSPEREVEDRELQELIYETINKLEFKQRTTLVLFYLQDFSLSEISEIMDCPVGTIKSRLHYARTNLRRELLADKRLAGGLVYEFT